ncbi:hypothetical protein [Streptomyces sp. SP18CS02]|uniref:hypothetical protein n=1 Tax=Streptomyces sp. SP18CS02 TaxID=3002531 RepID=UPI002E7A0BF9|nr:hypothetical protein [Streptomyces sp. SP18CS02]MEE1751543.1 hypothetical protein [Streptomyces sp. SP18CS02]
MSGDPYDGHNPLLVILLALAGIVVTPWLTLRAVVLLSRGAAARAVHTAVRGAVALVWAGAVGMYGWGVLHLVLLDESNQALACREVLGPERSPLLDRYEPSFVPLRFGCHVRGGQTYEAAVPGYVNPVAGALGVAAVALTFAVRFPRRVTASHADSGAASPH